MISTKSDNSDHFPDATKMIDPVTHWWNDA